SRTVLIEERPGVGHTEPPEAGAGADSLRRSMVVASSGGDSNLSPKGGAMAERRSPVTDVRELVRRLRMGEPDRRIARDLGVSRNTVARYRGWAQQHNLLAGELPPLETLAKLLQPVEAPPRPPHEQSQVEPFRDQVQALRQRGVEGQAIWQILIDQHGFTGSYSAIKRFLRRLAPPHDGATVRLEVAPGDEAQVDFGFAGQFFDPETNRVRRAWV